MRLRRPCQHDRYEAHYFLRPGGHPESSIAYGDCPGGGFLPEDAEGARQALDHVKQVIASSPERFPRGFRWTDRLIGNIDEIARYFHDDDEDAADQVGEQ